MKIGFAGRLNPLDKRSWSGTSYYTYHQIKKNFEVEIFNYKWTWSVREWLTMQKSLNQGLFKKNTVVEFLRSYAKYFSKQLQKDIWQKPVDVLFVSASSQFIAYLETDIPIIYMTDASFQQLQGYYPYFSNLPAYNVRQGIELDKQAFQKTSHCMLASDWCMESAVRDYGINPAKISVIPCGANLDHIPSFDEINFEPTNRCNLLFLGVEWERKGGDIALDTYRWLRRAGINTTLHIVGCLPPNDLSGEAGITVIPFLDKNKTNEFLQLQNIFFQTDFLLLPTRAECAGIVFSESSAYGIPSITTGTGGVPSYVKDGINGFVLPLEAGAELYAKKIQQLVSDQQAMKNLKLSSRKYYEDRLNWDIWGKRFKEIADQLVRH